MIAHTGVMVTTKRGTRYWIKRSLPGIGRVERTLGTTSQVRARDLERMIVSLHGRGRLDLVRAWLDGRVTLPELWHHYDTGTLHTLTDRLSRASVPTDQAVREFVNHRRGSVKPRTIERYEASLAHFTRLSPPDLADALTDLALETFQATRIGETVRGRTVQRETVNNDMVAISSLATYALKRKWISARPTIPKFPTVDRIRYLDPRDITVYMAALRPAFRLQMLVLLRTGVRLGVAERMTPADLKWDGAGLTYNVPDAKRPAGVRPVHVPADVADELRAYLVDRDPGPTDRLFTIPRRTVQLEHKRACRIAGLPGYTVHDHRHTAAVLLARAGMPITLIKDQLGHKTLAQTMKYARFHPDHTDTSRYFARVTRTLKAAPVDVPGDSTGNGN